VAFNKKKFRKALDKAGDANGQWAGIPYTMEDQKMVIEPRYPFASIFNRKREEEPSDEKVMNTWFCSRLRTTVGIIRQADGKYRHGIIASNQGLEALFETIKAAACWEVEAEIKAMEKLSELIPGHLFDMYCLTGIFLETSKRSGVTYWFRRLRPTIAMRPGKENENMHVLCALCLHPVGYYEGGWAGAMVPTDDVLAHLLLMRSDEHYFWKKANQIPAYLPSSGIGG
jgi:hypothetical protein